MKSTPGAYGMKGFGAEDILRRMMYASDSRTQSELAEKLGVRRAAVTDAKRRNSIPADWYLRLCRAYQVNPLWIETGLGSPRLVEDTAAGMPLTRDGVPVRPAGGMVEAIAPDDLADCRPDDFAYIPKVAAVPRMGPEGLETSGEVEAYYAFRREWLQRKCRGALTDVRLMAVAGDSMEPTLRDSDIVLVDQAQKDVIFGKIYVVGIDDGIVVKRLDKRPGKLVLISDNRAGYPPLEVGLDGSSSVRVIGRVIWMAREVF